MCQPKSYSVILFVILLCCAVATPTLGDTNSDLFKRMQQSSIVFGLTTISHSDMVSARCYEQLQDMQKGILQQQPWAVKMYDASGSRDSGFITGNGLWLGSRDTCDAVKKPINLRISKHIPHIMNPKIIKDTAPFSTDFRVVHMWHNSSWQIDPVFPYYEPRVSLGLCLPSSCTISEIRQLMSTYVESEIFMANDFYNTRVRVERVTDLKLRPGFFTRPSSLIFATSWVLTLILTLWALARRMKRSSEDANVIESEEKFADGTAPKRDSNAQQLRERGFIDCFEVQNNWRLLFPSDAAGQMNGISAVNGLRFYGAMAVTLFHLLCISYLATGNKSHHHKVTDKLGNFDVFVDLFFTMSGFLQVYHFFRNTKTIEAIRTSNLLQNTQLVLLHLFHRLLRLGPLYIIATCLADAGSLMIDDLTVFHFSYRLYEKCELYWWRNALFIQNLFNHGDLCVFWTWSSACDMQFFILSTILLITYVRHPKSAIALILSITAVNLAYTFYIGTTMNFEYSLETTSTLFTELYMNPLSRVFAYIIGGVAAWFFVQNQQHKLYSQFFQNQSLLEFLGYLAVIFFFTCSFATIEPGYSVFFYVVFLVVQRLLFSASVCCMIFANALGSVKWFFRVLENPIFSKFNQITYAMFLTNPMCVSLATAFGNAGLYTSPMRLIVDYIGHCAVLYFTCTIFSLFFEVPYKNISKLMLLRLKSKTS
ncbi:O-acyltransferase like protein-like isoform X1 [Anastrepha ludens]|uniref:O-acyltransferase like protein-like isoform X1 n=1 Tax=Anastrepha ludens TaxID=28586 RepID=UPI0023B011D5|nr:O-acyltransferase like protein-like isoform X1 [Anastrepha ludens]